MLAEHTRKIEHYWPCSMGRTWFSEQASLEEAWLSCTRIDWIGWLLASLKYENYDAVLELVELQIRLSGLEYTKEAKEERATAYDVIAKQKMRVGCSSYNFPRVGVTNPLNARDIWHNANICIFAALNRGHSVISYVMGMYVKPHIRAKYLSMVKAIIPFTEIRGRFLGEK